jgi:leader peptidase (prepilin peptidase)/N-methyltransferase
LPSDLFFPWGAWLILGILGACWGSVVNWATYELAYFRRPISPWSAQRVSPVSWRDRLPIIGWIFLRREGEIWGRHFWIRPLLVETFCAVGLPALYWWEVVARGLDLSGEPMDGTTLHIRFGFHVILFGMMLAGSLIDLDEKTLPDALTVPGTWLALLIAAGWPWALLPDFPYVPSGLRLEAIEAGEPWMAKLTEIAGDHPRFLHVGSPGVWPAHLEGFPRIWPLLAAWGIWWFWCFALMDRRWYSRLGWRRAWRYFWARFLRSPATWFAVRMGVVGTGGILVVWLVGGPHWRGLFSALVGLGAGVGLVWIVRILGWWALQREAMGFGDVTLMGMLGAAVGWQGSLIIFFLAPIVALVFAVVNLVLRQESLIPYGPFLCVAAAGLILGWQIIWPEARPVFGLGGLLFFILGGCLLLLPPLLVFVRLCRQLVEGLLLQFTTSGEEHRFGKSQRA